MFLTGFFAFKILQPEMPGRIYIQKQTQLKPENMAEVLQERKKKELQTMMDSGAIDVIAAFDDYALFWRFARLWLEKLWRPRSRFCVRGSRAYDIELHRL